MLRSCQTILSCPLLPRNILKLNNIVTTPNLHPNAHLQKPLQNLQIVRHGGSFDSRIGKELWKTVTEVSIQGIKTGRKPKYRAKNLNAGQILGFGKARVAFKGNPATNYVFSKDDKNIKPKNLKLTVGEIPEAKLAEYEQNILIKRSGGKILQNMETKKKQPKRRPFPINRGWTGPSPLGVKMGVPELPIPDESIQQMETVLVQNKFFYKQTTGGRVRMNKIMVLIGNRDGLFGYSFKRVPWGAASTGIRQVVNRSGYRLCYFDRLEERTIYHNFFSRYGHCTVFATQKPPGHGIVAHRCIKEICKLVGIKDIHVKCEGDVTNYRQVTRAFVLGLLRQRTYQELANEKQLHLVELREERFNYPEVVASPEDGYVRTESEINKDEKLDFEWVSYDGFMPHYRKTYIQKMKDLWQSDLHPNARIAKTMHHIRNHPEQRLRSYVEDGRIKSHLTDKFPECVSFEELGKRKMKKTLAVMRRTGKYPGSKYKEHKNARPSDVPKPSSLTHKERLKKWKANRPRGKQIAKLKQMQSDVKKLKDDTENDNTKKIKKLKEECQKLYETIYAQRIKNRAEKKRKLEEEKKKNIVEEGTSNADANTSLKN